MASSSSRAQTITLTQLPTASTAQSTEPAAGPVDSSEPLDVNFAEDENAAGASGQYPRADGGKDAWLFLAGCFAVEMLVWYVPLVCPCMQWPRDTVDHVQGAREWAECC